MIQSLCVPCHDRCRYCLLSWDGKTVGAAWERSVSLAERFIAEVKSESPEINCNFSFGYSMEHPNLKDALGTLRRLGSPMADFLQMDGMKMRNEAECIELMEMLKEEEVKQLNFTVYGLPGYHDRFAGRKGDYSLISRMMDAAAKRGISFTAGIPLTSENVADADELVLKLRDAGCSGIRLFIPHEEGRGKNLDKVRVSRKKLFELPSETLSLLNGNIYKTESEWIKDPDAAKYEKRSILISLTEENIEEIEKRSAESVIEEIEGLDDAYYAAFPSFEKLAEMYGRTDSDDMYSIRDLYHRYRRLYAKEYKVNVYDVTDERFCGSRRY